MIAALYARFYQEISRFALSLTRNGAEAEDIAQDTFLRALRHADIFIGMTSAQCRGWLYRTVKNLFIDHTRRMRRESPGILREEGQEDDTSAVYVAQMMACLPPEDQALFSLRYFEGMNASELSDLYGLPASTIRSRLLKCRTVLQRQYEQQRRDEAWTPAKRNSPSTPPCAT